MNADLLQGWPTRLRSLPLGSTRRIYYHEEMGDALAETRNGFAGDPGVRGVVVTGERES